MTTPFEILVVSSDLNTRRHLSEILVNLGLDPVGLATLRECYETIAQSNVGLIFCDARVADGGYEDLLSTYRLAEHKPRVVVTSPGADWEEFKDAMRLGAFDVISAPCRPTDVEWMVIQARRDERNRSQQAPPRPGQPRRRVATAVAAS